VNIHNYNESGLLQTFFPGPREFVMTEFDCRKIYMKSLDNLFCIICTLYLLRSSIDRSSQAFCHCCGRKMSDESKISNFGLSIRRNENVCRFQVPVRKDILKQVRATFPKKKGSAGRSLLEKKLLRVAIYKKSPQNKLNLIKIYKFIIFGGMFTGRVFETPF
jgi:hypothetical protein